MDSYKQSLSTRLEKYVLECCEDVKKTNFGVLGEIAEKILKTKENGKTIYIAGNGGSAATASHMANDLTKGCRIMNRTGFRAICLNDSVPVNTCLANDFSYEEVFSILLKTQAKPGDLFVVYSGSGNSPNVIEGVKTAKEMGLDTIGFSGRDGGKLKGLCDTLLIAPTQSMEQLEDMHMIYEHSLIVLLREMLMDTWDKEVVRFPKPGFPYGFALFDFDGTISLIREGWREMMIPYFGEILFQTPKAKEKKETKESLEHLAADFIDELTGKQTIFQCMRLKEEVELRGGVALDPLAYKKEFLARLEGRIAARKEELTIDSGAAQKYLVPGVKPFLEALKAKGVQLYLASGTDHKDVQREAKLLGIWDLFEGKVYGALDEQTECSKETVIQKILAENKISGNQLISFGDGYVEIELVRNLGGYAVAVATDEKRRKGVNQWKRTRLLSADACMVIPDFENHSGLMDFLFR